MCLLCEKKNENKKKCDPQAKHAHSASTQESNGADYTGWKYQPTPQENMDYAGLFNGSDSFCHC